MHNNDLKDIKREIRESIDDMILDDVAKKVLELQNQYPKAGIRRLVIAAKKRFGESGDEN